MTVNEIMYVKHSTHYLTQSRNVNSVSQKQTSIEKKTIWKVKETLEREWRSGRKGGGVNKAKAVMSKESPLGVTEAPSIWETQLL